VRGNNVYEIGDVDAGIWSVGTSMGLIKDIPTVGELVSRIVDEAGDLITSRRRKRTWLKELKRIGNRQGVPVLGKLSRVSARRVARAGSDRLGQRLLVVELLRGIALYQDIAVVERLEVNLDDISTGVVDPHVLDSRGLH
jgi:hypothetical protein